MDAKTLEFLKKEMPELYAHIGPENEVNTEKTVRKSDETLFAEALPAAKNKKLQLLYSLCRAEHANTRDKFLDVSHAAADADDFVTALYWHEKLSLAMPQDLPAKFERQAHHLRAAASSAQLRDIPRAEGSRVSGNRSEIPRKEKGSVPPAVSFRFI